MKILKVEVTNFGSYPHLEFDFTKGGLSLLYGKTGAGKSTLIDAICWCLFGVTPRGGSIDSVRTWDAVSSTAGTIWTEAGTICRTRRPNDLYYNDQQRGKGK